MADIRYLIQVDSSGAVKSVKDFDAALEATGKAGEKAHPKVKTFNDVIANSGKVGDAVTAKVAGLWKQIISGEAILDVSKKALGFLVDTMKDCVKAATEDEASQNRLKTALDSTGRSTASILPKLSEYATALSKNTLYTKQDAEASMTLLAQMTNLDVRGIQGATRSAMGLASALGIDLKSATQMLVKSSDDNTAALKKAGIEIDKNLKGDELMADVLEKTSKLYDRATADTETYGGRVKNLNKAIDELKGTIGTAVVNSDTFNRSLVSLKGVIEDLTTIASKEGKNWIDWMAEKAAKMPILGNLISTLETVKLKLRLEAAEVEYNERVYKGLKIALVDFDKLLMSHGVDIEKITGGLIKHQRIINETGTVSKGVTKTYSEMVDELGKLAKDTDLSHSAITKLDRAFQGAQKSGKFLDSDLKPIAEKLIALKTQAGEVVPTALRIFAGELDKTAVPADRTSLASENLRMALYALGFSAKTTGGQLGESLVPTNAGEKLERLRAIMGHISPEWKKQLEEMEKQSKEKMQKIRDTIRSVISQIDAVFAQANTNRMAEIDNEYNARKKAILAMQIDEVQKNAMLENLDKEFEVKRRDAQRSYAKAQKAVALANAVVNTAEGVTKALASAPPPFNIILAAITAAAGAVQIALIARQPLPLAKGAVFTQPTRMMTERGGYYEVGEAGPEALLPVAQIPAVAQQMGGQGFGRAERVTPLHIHLSLDGREIKELVINIIEGAAGIHKLNLVGARI